MALIDKQTTDPNWGAFATQSVSILEFLVFFLISEIERLKNGEFSTPRKGKKNDKAHPPIHPTKYAGNLAGDEKRVYEFVTRRFLACCSKDAEGQETTVEVLCGGEYFSASGIGLVSLTLNASHMSHPARSCCSRQELSRCLPLRQVDREIPSAL